VNGGWSVLLSQNPSHFTLSALQDGLFLVEFYIAHPQDVPHNAVNQHFWLQYCKANGISNGNLDAHLITPSDTLEGQALCLYLHPVRCWTNLTHGDTYIHGPFNFATVRGRKTCNQLIRNVGMLWPPNHLCF
jgi:hypothetical protein